MKHPNGLHAWTVRVGEKGQIVIPKEARDLFDIHPGDTLLVLGDDKRGLAIPHKEELTNFTASLLGINAERETDDPSGKEEDA